MWRSRRLENSARGTRRQGAFGGRSYRVGLKIRPSKELVMSPGILGKKIGMTQMFRPDGQAVPVTLLKAGPCVVVQRKTQTTDGYDAIQLGLVEFIKPQRINKPITGHLKKAGAEGSKFMREFTLRPGDDDFKAGDKVLAEQFKPKDKVDVIGVSK